jgi:hypothetical protein
MVVLLFIGKKARPHKAIAVAAFGNWGDHGRFIDGLIRKNGVIETSTVSNRVPQWAGLNRFNFCESKRLYVSGLPVKKKQSPLEPEISQNYLGKGNIILAVVGISGDLPL